MGEEPKTVGHGSAHSLLEKKEVCHWELLNVNKFSHYQDNGVHPPLVSAGLLSRTCQQWSIRLGGHHAPEAQGTSAAEAHQEPGQNPARRSRNSKLNHYQALPHR